LLERADHEILVGGPLGPTASFPPEEIFMAKALLGHIGGTDPRVTARLARENQLLRQRIADLEGAVLRLQMENDTFSTIVSKAADEVLEPA